MAAMLLLWVLGITGTAQAEIFTSIADIQGVLQAENGSIELVQAYIRAEYERLNAIRRILDTRRSRFRELNVSHTVASEPLDLFVYLKRLVTLKRLITEDSAEASLRQIADHRTNLRSDFPTAEDVDGASMALFRLQDTYNLETKAVADGMIPGSAHIHSMSAKDCYDLGRTAIAEKDFYHAVLWLLEAERRSTIKTEKIDVQMALAHALFKSGNIERALMILKNLSQLVAPQRHDVGQRLRYYEAFLKLRNVMVTSFLERSLPELRIQRRLPFDDDWFLNYERLCRGEWGLTEVQKAQLSCYYKANRPYLRLARLKAEIVHLRPDIVLFRDVISDPESATIQYIATPRFTRAGIVEKTGDFETTDGRISKIAWILDEESDTVHRISRRVEDMTDLSCSTAEYLQISHYGIGGHYEPHYDFALDDSPKAERATYEEWGAGNRIATVLFYITEPTAGGATVFPDLNLTLYPSKNDAVFWYNLHRSGKGDIRLRHAACPVLSGLKWVANKWLHEFGQEFLRPCALQ